MSPFSYETDEHLAHRAAPRFVERERLARPVERAAELLELRDDVFVVLLLPLPGVFEELLARQVLAAYAPRFEIALDDLLRGDSRVVGPRERRAR